ncbi:hypothetical protein ACFYRY_22440 [Streptomyces sp. NPDC005263]|uniref:hypothetical protein n=1 Tax=Streptomyces sp. NPDC005263 TaxID=3364711 RepID=UPI003694F1A0
MTASAEPPTNGTAGLRLLPWTTPDGRPCYLSTDNDRSMLSRLADEIEAAQLASGEQVLAGARDVLADPGAGERAVRFALTRAVESLGDALRVANCRDRRVPRDEP